MAPLTLAQGHAILTHAVGLHARPSVKLAKLAKSFGAQVSLRAGETGEWIDAKSVVQVMGLKAKAGEALYVRAEGEDADAAVEALTDLIRRDFADGPAG